MPFLGDFCALGGESEKKREKSGNFIDKSGAEWYNNTVNLKNPDWREDYGKNSKRYYGSH